MNEASAITTDTAWLVVSPMCHIMGIGNTSAVLYNGAKAVLEDGVSSLKNIYDAIKNNNCTHTICPPSMIQLFYTLTKNNISKLLGTLKIINIGGAVIPLEMRKRLPVDLPNAKICLRYGASEATITTVLNLGTEQDKFLSVGKPMNAIIKIVDSNNREIKSSKENPGRLAIQSDRLMHGYWKDESLTKQSLVDGWVIINDLACIDDDGYLYILGRADDIINSGGKKISPLEIEDAVNAVTGVQECCCIPVPDPKGILGDVPVVFVVINDTVQCSVETIYKYLNQNLDKYKLPHKIIAIDEIPKNNGGKYLRRELIEIWCRIQNKSNG
jgi:long-chain acyl-CoA synthetase